MRTGVSIISFLSTLLAGLAIGFSTTLVETTLVETPLVEAYWPSFTYDEAVSKLNQQARYHRSEQLEFFKYSGDGVCRRVADGEVGRVVAIEQVPDGGYFLVVAWGEPAELSHISHLGRYSYRKGILGQ